LGGYRILRRLGEGGMGAVYLAYHQETNRQVALKVLNESLAGNQSFVDRFYREARSGAHLNHPNIVRTYAAGKDAASGRHYLVLEFVDGLSAHALCQESGRLSIPDAVHLALDVARALEHAHSRNIVHRDIKPDNILLTRAGLAKLADLGLAKRVDEASHLTVTRQGFGTTHYMPFEQAINAKDADGRSDIYALGATLYHLLTGQVPFPGDNHLEVVEKKERGDFAAASLIVPEVPRLLDQILARMMARHPDDRYQTASELIVDLERSKLAAAVPSFADPERVLQDPWMRARLTNPAEPTRPDLDGARLSLVASDPTPEPTPVLKIDDQWVLRFRNREGVLRRVRATTPQIVKRLGNGALSSSVEARRSPTEDFRPLHFYPEFKAASQESDENLLVLAVARASRSKTRWLILGVSVVVLVAGFLIARATF
jgi:serine/threonine-protein kinase